MRTRRRTARSAVPVAIEPTAVYTRRELPGLLRLGMDAVEMVLREGKIRYRVAGNRHLYLGEWILDYLRGERQEEGAAV